MAAGLCGWSHDINSLEGERGERWPSDHFLLFIQSGTLVHGMVPYTFQGDVSSPAELSTLKETWTCVSRLVLNSIKLTVRISHHSRGIQIFEFLNFFILMIAFHRRGP